uniref:Arginyl-tRNA--protein transferase 1 n=2 Tax=Lygus hesperus TaxID=30085 RepID=A0A146L2A2_LYGHE
MNHSVVQYLSKDDSSCGYCKSSNGNVSHGMWAHSLTVGDYQNLIDRGWRRCGLYCYKPVMNEICCPAYTIRCDALNLKLTKSQKKVLRHFNAFLRRPQNINVDTTSDPRGVSSDDVGFKLPKPVMHNPQPLSACEKEITTAYVKRDTETNEELRKRKVTSNDEPKTEMNVGKMSLQTDAKPGVGEDKSKPKCKKAKMLRLERRKAKLQMKGITETPPKEPPSATEKTLEDYINECEGLSKARNLELVLVPACSDESILQESWLLYKKYQTVIHNDEEDECTFSGFSNFLVSSPLQAYKDDDSPPCGYGSFHQLYKLDGKLIAVGVIDILPKCVSSVYFFYDPEYSQLSLGTYGTLRELELTRKYAKQLPLLNQYYLGFYIHSCAKMRYKGNIRPSYLLCPEVYSWHPFDTCLSKIEASKYSRLNDDPNVKSGEDNVNIDEILVLTQQGIMPYPLFKTLKSLSTEEQELVKEYALLVGVSYKKMFLRIR